VPWRQYSIQIVVYDEEGWCRIHCESWTEDGPDEHCGKGWKRTEKVMGLLDALTDGLVVTQSDTDELEGPFDSP
jgi:hypothetical protein